MASARRLEYGNNGHIYDMTPKKQHLRLVYKKNGQIFDTEQKVTFKGKALKEREDEKCFRVFYLLISTSHFMSLDVILCG